MYEIFKIWLWPSLSYVILFIEIPVIFIFIGKVDSTQISLGGLGAAISILAMVNSPALVLATTSTYFFKLVKGCSPSLTWFTWILSGVLSLCLLLINLTPLGIAALKLIVNNNGELLHSMRWALFVFTLSPIIVAFRRFFQGLLISTEKTSAIVLAAFVRLIVSIFMGWILINRFTAQSSMLGALALLLGALSETVILYFSFLKTRHIFSLTPVPQITYTSIIKFHLPLSIKAIIEFSSFPLITFAISRADNGSTAIIVWPILLSMIQMFEAFTRELEPITVSVQKIGNGHTMRNFSLLVGVCLSVVWLFWSQFSILKTMIFNLFALSHEHQNHISHVLIYAATLPLFASLKHWLRGFHSTYGSTIFIQIASFAGFVGLLSFILVSPIKDGLLLGILGMTFMIILEIVILTKIKAFKSP